MLSLICNLPVAIIYVHTNLFLHARISGVKFEEIVLESLKMKKVVGITITLILG